MQRRNKSILCLSQDAVMLRVRQLVLEHFGYQVWPTNSVDRVAGIAVGKCPDMLLMDNGDPGVNLEELASRVKMLCPGLLAVVLSPFYAVHRSSRTPIDRFLAQDEAPDVLLANLEELFASQSGGGASVSLT